MADDRWHLVICAGLAGEPRLSVARDLPRFSPPARLVMAVRIAEGDALQPLSVIQKRIMAGSIKLWAS